MYLRFMMVSVVVSLGIDLDPPSGHDLARWAQQGQVWCNARLEQANQEWSRVSDRLTAIGWSARDAASENCDTEAAAMELALCEERAATDCSANASDATCVAQTDCAESDGSTGCEADIEAPVCGDDCAQAPCREITAEINPACAAADLSVCERNMDPSCLFALPVPAVVADDQVAADAVCGDAPCGDLPCAEATSAEGVCGDTCVADSCPAEDCVADACVAEPAALIVESDPADVVFEGVMEEMVATFASDLPTVELAPGTPRLAEFDAIVEDMAAEFASAATSEPAEETTAEAVESSPVTIPAELAALDRALGLPILAEPMVEPVVETTAASEPLVVEPTTVAIEDSAEAPVNAVAAVEPPPARRFVAALRLTGQALSAWANALRSPKLAYEDSSARYQR